MITLDAAPIGGIVTSNTPIVYTPWELIHRTAMMQGFTWGGEMANYVTPAMYIGTPLQTNQSTIGYNTDL